MITGLGWGSVHMELGREIEAGFSPNSGDRRALGHSSTDESALRSSTLLSATGPASMIRRRSPGSSVSSGLPLMVDNISSQQPRSRKC